MIFPPRKKKMENMGPTIREDEVKHVIMLVKSRTSVGPDIVHVEDGKFSRNGRTRTYNMLFNCIYDTSIP